MVRAAITQICSTPDILSNLQSCRNVISKAAKAGAALIMLPEASDFIARSADIYSLTHSKENADFLKGVQEEAKQHKCWIGVGVHEPCKEDKERVYNTSHLIDKSGNIVSSYRKTHMFDVSSQGMQESKSTIPGGKLVDPTKTPVGNLGQLICYDLRFAEAALHLRKLGAQIITYPSAFTTKTGPPHWETLLRARAIESQSYILAAAQVGNHYPEYVDKDSKIVPSRFSYGYGCIIDPWGTVLASAATGKDTFAIAEIDLDFLQECRKDMPLWEQRRNDLYPEV